MSYAAKFASAFYGPFRDAVEKGLLKGDKKLIKLIRQIGKSRCERWEIY